jgi:hypothetical protein
MSSLLEVLLHLAPLLPLFTRGLLMLRFWKQMTTILPEEALEREQSRSLILSLAGFSFTGLLALVILDSALREKFYLSIFYLLASFLAYMWAFNLQGYKANRWQSSAAIGLIESGTLSLLLSVMGILWLPAFDRGFSISLSLLAAFVWGLDHILRLSFEWRYLSLRENAR